MRLRCWWFGCTPDPLDHTPPDYLECMHCGESVGYGDLVGDTRHHRFMDWLVHLNVPALGVEQLSPDLWRDQVVDLVPQELEQGLLLFSAKLKWTFLDRNQSQRSTSYNGNEI